MSPLVKETVEPIFLGFAFGWLLQKAGLSRYDRIVNVFRFRDLAVLKFLLSALVTAAVGIRALQSLGMAANVPVPPTLVLANAGGGLVFGVGMALAGFCPGTVAAGAGEGRLDYLIPGGLGLYTGAVVYGATYERVVPYVSRVGNAGMVTFAALLHVEPWLVVALFVELALLTFYLIERPRRGTRIASRTSDASHAAGSSAPNLGPPSSAGRSGRAASRTR